MAACLACCCAGHTGDWPRWTFDLIQEDLLIPLSQMASAKHFKIDQNGSWKEIQIGSDFLLLVPCRKASPSPRFGHNLGLSPCPRGAKTSSL